MMIQQENSFDFGAQEYADLFDRSDATAFQSPVWLSNIYSSLAPQKGAVPLIITIRKEGTLVGVVPMIRRSFYGLGLVEATDLGVSDYSAPVLCPQFMNSLGDDAQASLRNEFGKALGNHHILRVRPVRQEHLSLWNALLDAEPAKLNFSAHGVELTPPFDDWRKANLDSKLAGMVARKGRRWKKQHDVSFTRIENETEVEAVIAELAKMRSGRFEGDPIQTEPVMKFYQAVASQGAASGHAETWKVTSDGDTAAIVFGLTHKGRFLYLLIGADYDGHGRHSPGLQMYDWIIEDWMERGGTCFDFTIGDEPFKAQFGTEAESMFGYLSANGAIGSIALSLFKGRLARDLDDAKS